MDNDYSSRLRHTDFWMDGKMYLSGEDNLEEYLLKYGAKEHVEYLLKGE